MTPLTRLKATVLPARVKAMKRYNNNNNDNNKNTLIVEIVHAEKVSKTYC